MFYPEGTILIDRTTGTIYRARHPHTNPFNGGGKIQDFTSLTEGGAGMTKSEDLPENLEVVHTP